jgi:hypothetical protein
MIFRASPAIGRVNSFRDKVIFRKHIHSSRGDANLLGESDETHNHIHMHSHRGMTGMT